MRQATKLEIKHFLDYRAKHVALVQRLGMLAFNDDFSTHDHDKLELNAETLNKFALWFAYKNGEYTPPTNRDLKILININARHYTTQKHHPEYWDIEITPQNFTYDMQIKATRMSKKAIREMVCDWTACSLHKNQPIFKFYNEMCAGDTPKFIFTENQKSYIINCLNTLQKVIDDENITWAGKNYDAKQIEPIRESVDYDKSDITEKEYLEIIYSEKFKEWFGDWEDDPENASKVVDSEGKPLIVYHGPRSTEEFNSFQEGYSFFTDNKKVAEMFANEYSYILTLDNEASYDLDKESAIHLAQRIESYYYEDILDMFNQGIDNLIDVDDEENGYITTEDFNDLLETGAIQCGLMPQEKYSSISIHPNPNKVFCGFLNIRNPQIIDFNGKVWEPGDDNKILPHYPHDGSIIKNIIEGGYLAEIDGEDVPSATDYITTSPNQIKSINNNGNFSTTSNNIYEGTTLTSNTSLNESYFKSGYNWQKGMSNRAVNAYNDGKMPITYWKNNTTLNSAIKNESGCEDYKAISILTSLPIEAKLSLLTDNGGEYHHTSKFFNTTYFYEMGDLSNVTEKDAEEYKQQWKEYSTAKKEYNKFVKNNVNEEKGIVEDEKGVKQVTKINAFKDVKLPRKIFDFLKNDITSSQSGNIYIAGTKPTREQFNNNSIPNNTLKLSCEKNKLVLYSYDSEKQEYIPISSVELKTNISIMDIRKLKSGTYEGTEESTYLKTKPQWTGVLTGTLTEILKDKSDKFIYIVATLDGRYIHNTETTDLATAKKIRAEMSAEDGTMWYTIKKIPLKECEAGGNGFNGSAPFVAQAPENVRAVFVPQEDDILKDVKLKDFKESVIAELKESIIDVPQKEYYKGVLTEEDKMVPSLRKQIIQTIYDWIQLIDFNFNVYKIVAKGSLLTKRYNDTTDLDVTVYTNLSKSQLDSIYNLIPRGENIKVDGEETSHSIDIYILTDKEKSNVNDNDNVYDVANDKWIKRSDEYDLEIPLNYALEVANFFINGCTIALSNYHNDKILYAYYKSLDTETQEITDKEKTEALARIKASLQTDLDGMRLALYMISSFRQDAYGEEPNPFRITLNITSNNPHNSLNEVMTKMIEKFGIKKELRDNIKECSELLGGEIITESVNKNEVACFTFGRMNVPTIGHLLLLTKLATTSADARYVYLSHTQDKKRNPLDYATKASLIKSIIKENNLNIDFIDTDARTIIDVAVDLYNKGYKNIIFVGGSDTAEEICTLLNKYNDVPDKYGNSYHFDSISYIVAGIRNPDSDDVEGVSATKVRQFAKNNDYTNFSKYLAIKDKHITKDIFEQVKKSLN